MAKRMTDAELTSVIDQQVSDAVSYDQSELRKDRIRALEYYEGVMRDTPAQPNRSSVVSYDVADTIGWIMPSLLRVFLSSDHVVYYEPRKPSDEAAAKQATDYVNYVFQYENDGYKVLYAALFDGLLFGNGVIKHWWDATPEYSTESHSNLSDDAFLMLMADPMVEEAVEHDTREEQIATDPMTGEPVMVALHDAKIKRRTSAGKLCIMAVPGEEFLIERNATSLDEEDSRFVGHRSLRQRGELIAEGYDRKKVEALPTWSRIELDEERNVREQFSINPDNSADDATALVEVHECYVKLDYDGDGVAEWRKIVIGGASGSRSILANEEWGDDLPFTDLVPDPMPHRWRGRSVFDDTQDVQRVKTVLLRQTLDNMYASNNPRQEVVEGAVLNPDSLVDPEFGETHFVRAAGSITPIAVPFVAQHSFQMLEYQDGIREMRTGISRATQSLDLDALQNQTATAVNAARSASYTKIESYARNIAEVGLKRLFGCLLKLIVKHQDVPKTIKLRGQWVEMNPAGWDADMDVTINIGLGSGSRDRDMAMLQGVLTEQKTIIAQLGPMNPIVPVDKYRNTLAKMVEIAGLRSPEQFFAEVDEEVMGQLQQQMQAAQQGGDGDAQKEAAKLQMEQQKMQAQMQMDMQKVQAEFEMRRAEMQAQRQSDMERVAQELALKREQMEIEAELRRDQMRMEIEAKIQIARMQAEIKGAVDVSGKISNVQMGGDIG